MTKLSEFQRRTIEAIRAGGGLAYYVGGGYWASKPGDYLHSTTILRLADGAIVPTQTIVALERLELVRRRPDLPHRYRDPVELVEG